MGFKPSKVSIKVISSGELNGLPSPVVYSSVWTVIFNKCEALSVDLKTEQGEKPLPDTRGWIKT